MEPESDRELFLLALPSFEASLAPLTLRGSCFTCLVVAPHHPLPKPEYTWLAEWLLASGAVYIHTWGPDCEQAHDLFDDVRVREGLDPRLIDDGRTTVWHNEVSLDEALWTFLFASDPPDQYFDGCRSGLVVTVSAHEAVERARVVLADTVAFRAAHFDSDGAA